MIPVEFLVNHDTLSTIAHQAEAWLLTQYNVSHTLQRRRHIYWTNVTSNYQVTRCDRTRIVRLQDAIESGRNLFPCKCRWDSWEEESSGSHSTWMVFGASLSASLDVFVYWSFKYGTGMRHSRGTRSLWVACCVWSQSYPPPNSPSSHERQFVNGFGWYDEQFFARCHLSRLVLEESL